jgi:hypothetical protein
MVLTSCRTTNSMEERITMVCPHAHAQLQRTNTQLNLYTSIYKLNPTVMFKKPRVIQ